MRCRTCGRSNRADAIFCDACGARLGIPGDGVQTSVARLHVSDARGIVPPPQAPHPSQIERWAEKAFVGRQPEMAALQMALQETQAGRAQLVMLVGEPGIGKTRTAQELCLYAERRGARVLWGRCYENPGAPPYWPWVQVIRAYIRDRNAAQWPAEMGPGAVDIADLVPELRDCLPGLPPLSPLIDPDQARVRLFDAVTTLLRRAATQQALVVVLDNLHWADKPSLLLLEFLMRELAQSRLLIIGTYRNIELSRRHPLSETLAELTRASLFQRALLKGLSREDVERFIRLATDSVPPPTLAAVLHAQTEGNPLYLTELVRLWYGQSRRIWRTRRGTS